VVHSAEEVLGFAANEAELGAKDRPAADGARPVISFTSRTEKIVRRFSWSEVMRLAACGPHHFTFHALASRAAGPLGTRKEIAMPSWTPMKHAVARDFCLLPVTQ